MAELTKPTADAVVEQEDFGGVPEPAPEAVGTFVPAGGEPELVGEEPELELLGSDDEGLEEEAEPEQEQPETPPDPALQATRDLQAAIQKLSETVARPASEDASKPAQEAQAQAPQMFYVREPEDAMEAETAIVRDVNMAIGQRDFMLKAMADKIDQLEQAISEPVNAIRNQQAATVVANLRNRAESELGLKLDAASEAKLAEVIRGLPNPNDNNAVESAFKIVAFDLLTKTKKRSDDDRQVAARTTAIKPQRSPVAAQPATPSSVRPKSIVGEMTDIVRQVQKKYGVR